MNTASRMESTGIANRIQVSQQTADLLIAAGKEHWLTKRDDLVEAKGKGDLQTYFVSVNRDNRSDDMSGVSGHTGDSFESGVKSVDMQQVVLNVEKRNRSAEWAVELLSRLLKEMTVQRRVARAKVDKDHVIQALEAQKNAYGHNVLDEVVEIITMGNAKIQVTGDAIKNERLSQKVLDELREFVCTIASLYNDNRKYLAPRGSFDVANTFVPT
jgi:Adenylate and Guanylate cyclase catalytic domain